MDSAGELLDTMAAIVCHGCKIREDRAEMQIRYISVLRPMIKWPTDLISRKV